MKAKRLSNRELAEFVVSSMDKRDFTLYEKHVAEDAALDFPGSATVRGCRKIIVFLKAVLRKYPELQFTIENIIADKGWAAAVWSNKGKFKNGEPYSNQGVTLVKISAGKIVLISDYFKDTSFLKRT
jgi:ketosteroid isomerase-like protein